LLLLVKIHIYCKEKNVQKHLMFAFNVGLWKRVIGGNIKLNGPS
jgi:hypothetical protein